MKRNIACLIAILALSFPVLAHEGHGQGAGHELGHYLLSPAHAIPVAVALAMTVAIILFRRSRRAAAEKVNRGL